MMQGTQKAHSLDDLPYTARYSSPRVDKNLDRDLMKPKRYLQSLLYTVVSFGGGILLAAIDPYPKK